MLRFWESEFPGLGPKKSSTGQRQFRRKDVELVLEIKRLLYDKRFTIEGARKHLETRGKAQPASAAAPAKPPRRQQGELFGPALSPQWEEIRRELRAIARMLGDEVRETADPADK